jgi:hypothetical protein
MRFSRSGSPKERDPASSRELVVFSGMSRPMYWGKGAWKRANWRGWTGRLKNGPADRRWPEHFVNRRNRWTQLAPPCSRSAQVNTTTRGSGFPVAEIKKVLRCFQWNKHPGLCQCQRDSVASPLSGKPGDLLLDHGRRSSVTSAICSQNKPGIALVKKIPALKPGNAGI